MRIIKMDKKRLKIALAVLDAVRNRLSETQMFIDSTPNVKKKDDCR